MLFMMMIFPEYQILGSSLAIRNIAAEDDGFYHCVAKSNAGQAIGSRRLIVIGIPSIKISPYSYDRFLFAASIWTNQFES